MKESDPLSQEIEHLLQSVIIEEASESVWSKFEKALNKLPPEALELLENHLDGMTEERISAEKNLTLAETNSLLKKIKHELVQQLRQEIHVRQ